MALLAGTKDRSEYEVSTSIFSRIWTPEIPLLSNFPSLAYAELILTLALLSHRYDSDLNDYSGVIGLARLLCTKDERTFAGSYHGRLEMPIIERRSGLCGNVYGNRQIKQLPYTRFLYS